MIAQRNARRKDASRRFALVQLPSLIIIAGFVLIAIALYFMLAVSHQEAQANARFLSLLGGIMVFSGSIVLLVSMPSLFKSIKQIGYFDKKTSIRAERTGNIIFWIIFIISTFIYIIAWAKTENISLFYSYVLLLVFLLIIRRAYIRDRLRKIKEYKD